MWETLRHWEGRERQDNREQAGMLSAYILSCLDGTLQV